MADYGEPMIPVYSEYIEHDSIPGRRAYLTAPRGKRLGLHCPCRPSWSREFRDRRALVVWLVQNLPEATFWQFADGITVCGGSITCLAKRAGITIPAHHQPMLPGMIGGGA